MKGLKNNMDIPQNLDMAKLMSMLSQVNKSQLEEGLAKINNMLSTEEKEKIIKEFQKGK